MITQYTPNVSVDCLLLGFDYSCLNVLLVEMSTENKEEKVLKLPGSLVNYDHDLEDSVTNVLEKLTGIKNIYLEQLHTFGKLDRIKNTDEIKWVERVYGIHTERIITIAYYSLLNINDKKIKKERLQSAKWYNVKEIDSLAFDHVEILKKGLLEIRKELKINPHIAFELLPSKFTIRQLQTIYEIILDKKLDNRNFRKKILQAKYIIQLEEKEKNVAHKPAFLYRFDYEMYSNTKKESHLFTI